MLRRCSLIAGTAPLAAMSSGARDRPCRVAGQADPLLRARAFSQSEIDQILVHTPRRLLTFV